MESQEGGEAGGGVRSGFFFKTARPPGQERSRDFTRLGLAKPPP